MSDSSLKAYKVDDYCAYAGRNYEEALQGVMRETGEDRDAFLPESEPVDMEHKLCGLDENGMPSGEITVREALADLQAGDMVFTSEW